MNTILSALVNGILVSVGLALAIRTILWLLPRNSLNAATRYAIWWAMLVVTVSLPFSYFRAQPTQTALAPATSTTPIWIRASAPIAAPATSPGIRQPASANTVGFHFPLTIPVSAWPGRLLSIWILCSALMLVRLIVSAMMLERRKARASKGPPLLVEHVANWITTCGGSNRRVRLDVSLEISVPLVSGPYRPAILLPAKLLDELSGQDLDQIGIHEAAHLVRYDDYTLSAQRIIQALFSLHPVVHWISRHIDLEREIACDDFVIGASGNTQAYAACLARVVELSGGVRAMPVAAAAIEDRSHLARRVEMLLDRTRHTSTQLLGARLALALTLITALALGAAQLPGFVSFRAGPHISAAPLSPRLIAQVDNRAKPAVPAIPALPAVPAEPPGQPPVPPPLPAAAEPAIPAVPPTPPVPPLPPSPTVFIPVEVRDLLGRFVTGIDQSAFRIQEDGVDQVITQLTASDDPADLFVLVGSELVPDPELRSLLAERIPVAGAGNVVRVHGMAQLSPQTSFLEAAKTMQTRIGNSSSRQAVIVVTSSNVRNPESELRGLPSIDIPIYVIDVTNADVSAALTRLAAQNGVDYIAVKRQEDIPEQLAKIVIAIRNMYILEYRPRSNNYRSAQVSINRPRGLPPLTLRTHPGYAASER